MKVSTRTEGDIFVISVLEKSIDAATSLDFKDIMRTKTEGSPPSVVLDLGQVAFIDSSGLGAIVATMKHLAPQKTLILAALTPPVQKVFKLTRMDSVFSIFNTVDDAL